MNKITIKVEEELCQNLKNLSIIYLYVGKVYIYMYIYDIRCVSCFFVLCRRYKLFIIPEQIIMIIVFVQIISVFAPFLLQIWFKPFAHLRTLGFPNIFLNIFSQLAFLLTVKKHISIPAVWFGSNFIHSFHLSLRIVSFFFSVYPHSFRQKLGKLRYFQHF